MNSENNWFATDAGYALVEQAMLQAKPWLWPLCGHNALILQPCLPASLSPQLQCLPMTYLQHCNHQFMGDFKTDEYHLPLVNECMALVYAQFVLDLTENRTELLNEFQRVLLAVGHLAMFNLNPYGLYHLSGKWRGIEIKDKHYWSNLLFQAGFEICRFETIGAYWPSRSMASSDKIVKPLSVFRPVNFILARKRKSTLTPIRNSASKVAIAREIIQ
jgi:hypothetical protein